MNSSTTSSKKSKKVNKSAAYKLAAIAFWIIVWEAFAVYVGSELIIASPVQVAKKLWEMIFDPATWQSFFFSFVRIASGFLAALILGSALAAVSARINPVKILLAPITSVIKSTPVASFIILAIIWFGSKNLSVFISFLMVFPVIYLNVLKGIESVDHDIREMAELFKVSFWHKIIYVYMPGIMPFLISACSVALGLCWKSGVAAEVIGISTGSIGERLYRAKLYFETGELLAWTVVIISLSAAFEKIIMLLLKRLSHMPERAFAKSTLKDKPHVAPKPGVSVEAKGISKSFNGVPVLNDVSLTLEPCEHVAIMGRSGAGKTTLTRIIAGLEASDSGTLTRSDASVSEVFQEDRLIGCLNAVGNIVIAGGSADEAYKLLCGFGLTDDLIFKPCETLSGGEKRRVAIVRALLAPAGLVIMDEPFKGIDEATLESSVKPSVKKLTENRTLILITHDQKESHELCESVIEIK